MNSDNKRSGEKTREKMVSLIIGYIEEHGYAPSVREIGDMTGLKSTSSVHGHLERLFSEGRLETDAAEGAPRAFRVPGYKFVRTSE